MVNGGIGMAKNRRMLMIKTFLSVTLIITGLMSLINKDHLIYMHIAMLANSGFWLFTDLRSEKLNVTNIILHAFILILTVLVFIKAFKLHVP